MWWPSLQDFRRHTNQQSIWIEYRSNRLGPHQDKWLERFVKEEEEEDDDNSEKHNGWFNDNGWWKRDYDYYDAYYASGCDIDTEDEIDYEFYENFLLDHEKPTI